MNTGKPNARVYEKPSVQTFSEEELLATIEVQAGSASGGNGEG